MKIKLIEIYEYLPFIQINTSSSITISHLYLVKMLFTTLCLPSVDHCIKLLAVQLTMCKSVGTTQLTPRTCKQCDRAIP